MHPYPCPSATTAKKDKSSDGPNAPSLAKHGKLLKDFHRHHEHLAKQDGTWDAEDW